MKKIVTISISLAISSVILAQNWDEPKYEPMKLYEGYIITNEGDTIHGFLKAQYPNDLLSSNQNSCHFYKTKDQKKSTKYKPKEIKGYTLAGKHYVSMNYTGGTATKLKNFVLLVKKGGISEYVYYYQPDSKAVLVLGQQPNESKTDYYNRIYSKKTVYYREGATPYDTQNLAMGFKKKMAGLVADDKELASKVANKEKGYRMFQLQKIIDEYNQWYKAK